jgi:hypothetical protein
VSEAKLALATHYFDEAMRLMRARQYRAALVEFHTSYEISKHPDALRNEPC